MRHALDTCPQVNAMARRLGSDPDLVVGKLYRLWCYADQHSTDGILPYLDDLWLDKHFGLEGFADALQAVGWLELRHACVTVERDGGQNTCHAGCEKCDETPSLVLLNYDEHNGKTAKKRFADAQRAARHRSKKPENTGDNPGRHASVTVASRSSVTKVANERDLEKRREEKNIIENSKSLPAEGRPKKASRKTARPEDMQVTAKMLEYAQAKGFSVATAHAEFEKFCAYHDAKGTKFAAWDKAFQNWLLKAKEFNPAVAHQSPASAPAAEYDPLDGEDAVDPEKAKAAFAEIRQSLTGKFGKTL